MIEGKLNADGRRFALVVSRFNDFLTGKLADGARDCLERHGARGKDIEEIRVPGAFEIPAIARLAAESGRFDAVICIGAVIRGGTPHFDYVSAEVAKGVASLAMNSPVPVLFGVLTTDTLEQAIERSGSKSGNKGWEAALSAIEMVELSAALKGEDG